ncbi:hypothetical protein [Lentilactobacillus hilgardii]|uniref:hypothetical protein n=1 Tax=Lentilactobacillus hilgardii TaxID=1588 RepID=UPI00019C6544|nr:hypothetical protein [Lentilactobacillus hilgardii]EEI19444.1 hypothetical protein HMPREF0497_1789 [Lentilactobacillus buchneri ATCC 11577]MCT3396013.1 hypothetical protein [Lentilactobacillus hilgardii]QIR10211.1 hypothetical protein G8J22_02218 [Lentilactobacillus hilgardii]
MNKHDNEPQYKKYDFNSEQTRSSQRKRQYSGWWFALLILIIALGIAVSLSWFLTRDSSKSSNRSSTNNISRTIKKSESALKNRKTKGALTSKLESNRVNSFKKQLNQADNNGITKQQRSQLQEKINQESNQSVKSKEQSLLNQTQSRSNQPPKKPQAADPFATSHTFSSIQDAKNWANATKEEWLKAGYVNYTITSNGQGYYTLKFVK